jgi:branched-chain amino acid transport system substrate-binding protein
VVIGARLRSRGPRGPVLGARAASLSVALLVGCVPVLVACTGGKGGATKPPATVTIGLLATGAGDAVHGAELAVDVVNTGYPELNLPLGPSTGLSRGTRVVLAAADSKGDAAGAGQAAEQLVRQSRAVGVVFPLIDGYSSADFLGDLGREWYFRLGPTDRMLLGTAFDVLRQGTAPAEQGAARRAVVLEGATGQATGGIQDLAGIAETRRFTVPGRFQVGPGTNPAELADRVSAQKPDAVVAIVGTDAEAAVANDTVQRLKSTVPAVAVGRGVAGLGAVTGARPVLRTVGWSPDLAARNPVGKAVADLYQRRFNTPMNDVAAAAFTATLTMAVAIDRASGAEATQIRAALRNLWLPATETIMPWDGVRFGPGGQNDLAGGVVEQRSASGAFEVVYPRELARRPS